MRNVWQMGAAPAYTGEITRSCDIVPEWSAAILTESTEISS